MADTPSDEEIKHAMADRLLADLLNERRAERRWRRVKRMAFSAFGLATALAWLAVYLAGHGYAPMPGEDAVAVVHLSGPVGAAETASAEKVVPALEKAFKASHVKAVALQIDSPGGSPFESERIGDRLDALRRETGKPAYAFIGNTGASAAYLVALHADRIVCGRYSLVGSVGAVIAAWDFHRLLEKLDVDQRVYASGPLKNMLNPYKPMPPASDAKAQEMVDRMAATFAAEFKRLRQGKLKDKVDYFTGEAWGGEDALRLGLVDEVGTLDNVARREWNLPLRDFGPHDGAKGLFELGAAAAAGLLRTWAARP
jgi:protease-4